MTAPGRARPTGSLRRAPAASRTSRPGSNRHRAGLHVDRYLCAQMYLMPRFADWVAGQLLHPSLRAICPSFGLDLVTLARHAVAARRRAQATDLAFLVLLLLSIAGMLVAVSSGSRYPDAAAGAILVAVAGVVGSYVLVVAEKLSGFRRATVLFDRARPARDLAPPLDRRTEDELDAVDNANVVTFSGGVPFVGSGNILGRWKLSLDHTKPATDSSGRPRRIVPFGVSELFRELTLAVRGCGLPNLSVHNRLYVPGGAPSVVPGLLPDPCQRPRPVVDRAVLRQGIERPRPEARTYLCVQHTSWGGELIVSAFVRAEILSNHLFVEYHAYVLLPLREELCAGDLVPESPLDVARHVLRGLPSAGWRRMLGSPRQLHRRWAGTRAARRQLSRERDQVRRRRGADYGARTSIRQVVGDTDRVHLFAYVDEEMYLDTIQREVFSCIYRFLDAHGIDTSELSHQQTQIVSSTTYQIGNLSGTGNVLGSNGSVNNLQGSQVAGQPPPQNGTAPPAQNPPWAGP